LFSPSDSTSKIGSIPFNLSRKEPPWLLAAVTKRYQLLLAAISKRALKRPGRRQQTVFGPGKRQRTATGGKI